MAQAANTGTITGLNTEYALFIASSPFSCLFRIGIFVPLPTFQLVGITRVLANLPTGPAEVTITCGNR